MSLDLRALKVNKDSKAYRASKATLGLTRASIVMHPGPLDTP